MKIYKNISELVTLKSAHQKDGRHIKPDDLSIIKNGAIVFDNNKIIWVGETANIPKGYQDAVSTDLTNKTLVPEIVDSHTHLIFGGNRAQEYSMRLNGADYQAIANAGGGILNTMNGTNNASANELFKKAIERAERIASYGVGSIEVKSGYGLNYEKEKESTLLIDKLKRHFEGRIQIFNTFLAAHAVPQNYFSSTSYLKKVVLPLMRELDSQKVIDAVDVFHEQGYFSTEDTKLLFEEAQKLGLKVKSHADEFVDNDGAQLAVNYQALSCDHLMKTSNKGIKALAQSNTVATLLPGTSFFLGKPLAPAQKFYEAGCKVAIASDYNPGSCHCDNLLLIASLSAPQYKINIGQLWCSITHNSAHALGLKDQGAIIAGMKPRFAIFDVPTLDEITYHWGRNLIWKDRETPQRTQK